jgi:hypothetical protein
MLRIGEARFKQQQEVSTHDLDAPWKVGSTDSRCVVPHSPRINRQIDMLCATKRIVVPGTAEYK